jgi:hypothetical protein
MLTLADALVVTAMLSKISKIIFMKRLLTKHSVLQTA